MDKKTTKKKVTKKKKVVDKATKSEKISKALTKWDDSYAPIIKRLLLKGYYDYEIADLLGVTTRTYTNWKKSQPDAFLSEKELKGSVNERVVNSLYKLVHGYECKETKVFCTKDGKIIKQDVIKHFPPNQKSIEFVLANRDPDNWKIVSKVDVGIGDDIPKEFTLNYKQGDSKKDKKDE